MKLCPKCSLKYGDDSDRCLVDKTPLVEAPDPYLGKTIAGRYLIESKLGEGGMATVYRARHVLVDRHVAVKILGDHVASNANVRERFRREAKTAAALSHPNIIEIFDHGEMEDGAPFLVMELLVGHALADRVAQGPIPAPEAGAITHQIAQGLARAHDFGVVHRDLKPDNVFIMTSGPRPLVKLLDFGIARSNADSRMTTAGELFGTPQYMAPERLTSIDAGPSSDLYALGIMLFEMLTGRLPFDGATLPAMFLAHMQQKPPPFPPGLKVPEDIQRLAFALMEKTAEQRPVDAHAVLRELARYAPTDIGTSEPQRTRAIVAHTLPPTTLERWGRRTQLFDEMLRRAFPGGAPHELAQRLEIIRRSIADVQRLRTEGIDFQRRLDTIENETRETRARLGYAMQRVGEGLSNARVAQRLLEREVRPVLTRFEEAAARFRTAAQAFEALGAPSTWTEPSEDYAAAIDTLAAEHAAFHQVAYDTAETRVELDQRATEISDLEFQVKALREQFEGIEDRAEGQKKQLQDALAARTRDVDAMHQQLLSHGNVIVEAVRSKGGLADLFAKLEAESDEGAAA